MGLSSSLLFSAISVTIFLVLFSYRVDSQPVLDSDEQESAYRVLESINSEVPWRALFPGDLCSSAPHGVVCDFFEEKNDAVAVHITELSFGFVSDYTLNPPCTADSAINPLLSAIKHLRKIFFYKCFTGAQVSVPDFSVFGSSLEEISFVENPSLTGSLGGKLGNSTSLRRLVLTGTNVSGEIPVGLGDLVNLEQITLSRNKFRGEVALNFSKLNQLKLLDLSENGFEGEVPESIGGLTELLKVDLSENQFSGKIPESLKNLKNLEFLDLGYNHFANFGIPLFLAEMPRLREVHLSGNFLGGQIPEIWGSLRGIQGIGLSGTGLVGNIPASMGFFLRNLSFIGLDNNLLEGTVPEEFGSLESVNEMNLENNKLRGKLPFSPKFAAKMGEKLKLQGNPELCVDEGLRSAKIRGSLGNLKLCRHPYGPSQALFVGGISVQKASHLLMFLGFLFLLP
ncbi:ROP-interactive CRIB motif-containing protein 7 [Actinidia rufa]|uniref:ROP-interactive CRIB motif-containing protein 7 n=1 Tax=Actinidia rufa TaxID=165716 RepID=A0A7J0H3V2_9ERIC|nr:ROP-interactive CRIB motif-containing protein 7 [Actinidia rufa]